MHTLPTPLDLTPDYLRAVLDDEATLARLLGWTSLDLPRDLTPNAWIWGCHGEKGLRARLARTYLPRWRRDWGAAGELMSVCGLSIHQFSETVAVAARTGAPVAARYADHPSEDAAIRYCMVHAAIAYLEAGRAREQAMREALRAERARA